MMDPLWAELLKKLMPVLSGISIAIVAWLNGRKTAKLDAENDALREEIKARERITDLIEEENRHADEAQEVARTAPALRSGELSDAEFRLVYGRSRTGD